MAIAFVNRAQNTVTDSGVTSVSTASAAHTTGNLLVVTLNYQSHTGTFGTVSDTAGNTWTQVGTEQSQGVNQLRIYYAYNIVGHATNVVTATMGTGNCGYFALSVRQFSGFSSSDPIDGSGAQASGSGTAISSGTVTITGAEDVIVAMIVAEGQSLAAGTGYTLNSFGGLFGEYFADAYHIVTANEAATATCASGAWGIKAAAFKAPAATFVMRVFQPQSEPDRGPKIAIPYQ